MGTGANCSYADSSGGVTLLICNATECCDYAAHTCSAASCSNNASSEDSLSTYLFWVILAASTLFTLLILFAAYAICRYRRPGCADAGAARDQFLEENILAAASLGRNARGVGIGGAGGGNSMSVSPTSITPATSSPPAGHSPSHSPDLLVHRPSQRQQRQSRVPGRSMIPVKKPAPNAVNKAFILGAEAFARKPIVVQRVVVDSQASSGSASVAMAAQAATAGAGKGAGGRLGGDAVVGNAGSLALQLQHGARDRDVTASSGSGVTSPRQIQLDGFTPRVNIRNQGRTESKQTIISSDTDSMTAVGT